MTDVCNPSRNVRYGILAPVSMTGRMAIEGNVIEGMTVGDTACRRFFAGVGGIAVNPENAPCHIENNIIISGAFMITPQARQ